MSMKLENQVVSLELAKKLRKLGVEQESYFFWCDDGTIRQPFLIESSTARWPDKWEFSAYTVAELGELLPTEQNDRLGFFSGRAINGWFCEVKDYGIMPYDRLHVELQHETEADARAAMLIWLIQNELLDPKV